MICSAAGMLLGSSLSDCVRYALYQILVIFMPGCGIYVLLFRNNRSREDFYFLSYALGYALNILAYFAAVAAGLTISAARTISAVLLILAIILLIISRKREIDTVQKENTVFYVIFSVFFLIVFFAYSGRYILPGVARPSETYHADALYWIENAAALTKSFPPAELRMSGTTLFYHYFASAHLAFANMVTGIDIFSLGYTFYPLGKCMIFCGGLYELAKIMFEERRKQVFFLLALLFTTGLEKYSIANYVAHIVTLPFGFDIAYAYGALCLGFLFKQMKEERFRIRESLLCGLFLLMCTGHKAPVALVYLVAAGVLCLHWLIKKEPAKAFGNGALLVICFVLVMVVCIGLFQGKDTGVSAGGFSHVATLRATPLFPQYEEAALSKAPGIAGWIPVLLLYLKLMTLFALSINPLILFLEINGIVQCIRNRKTDVQDLALLLTVGAGLFMGFFNAQEGVSQLYYTLATYIPGMVFGLKYLHLDLNRKHSVVLAAAAGLFLFQVFCFFGPGGVASAAAEGAGNVFYKNQKYTSEFEEYSIQASDYEALNWIRTHTDPDSLLVCDRSIVCDLDNYMFYGTFSERQMYLEGDRYFYNSFVQERERRRDAIEALYKNSADALQTVKDDGADYIIQTKWATPDYTGAGCENVYETETIIVWKVRG